jgi:hypothetical protein
VRKGEDEEARDPTGTHAELVKLLLGRKPSISLQAWKLFADSWNAALMARITLVRSSPSISRKRRNMHVDQAFHLAEEKEHVDEATNRPSHQDSRGSFEDHESNGRKGPGSVYCWLGCEARQGLDTRLFRYETIRVLTVRVGV